MEEQNEQKNSKRVAVVVLGDLARSPRMQYHSLSLAQHGFHVDLIGYTTGRSCRQEVEKNQNIKIRPLRDELPKFAQQIFIFRAFYRLFITFFQLFFALWNLPKIPDFILVQNPPGFPTLLSVILFCFLRKSKLIIDWHNFGYTILRLSLGSKNPLVYLHYWYEKLLGKWASGHFCVTKAMRNFLSNWGINAVVLYDKPPQFFQPMAARDVHQLFLKLKSELKGADEFYGKNENMEYTPITEKDLKTGRIRRRDKRPALLISSTSWTPDEDFNIILSALVIYDKKTASNPDSKYPPILLIVTGRGPMKEAFETKIKAISFKNVKIDTMWLEPEDYPKLLGSADLGVSLHTSSSGLDLPMKVVDMFGSGLPVCAVNFACLNELVEDKVTGMLFSSPDELANKFFELLENFPSSTPLNKLKENVLDRDRVEGRWDQNWDEKALPIFQKK